MRILICGDVVARSGRETVQRYVPYLKRAWALDCVIANGENAQHGYGITARACQEMYDSGVDVITTGNHVWDQKELLSYIEQDPRVVRPINFMDTVPGKGFYKLYTPKGDVLVVSALGQIFVRPTLDNPFPILDNFLRSYALGQSNLKAIVVDFHAEATSEKLALGFHLDGRITCIVGTHTHVPTADARILPNGTAYISDLGMCGDYVSVIGAPISETNARYIRKIPLTGKSQPASGEGTLCALYIETDEQTGLSKRACPVRLGPNLDPTWPADCEMMLQCARGISEQQ